MGSHVYSISNEICVARVDSGFEKDSKVKSEKSYVGAWAILKCRGIRMRGFLNAEIAKVKPQGSQRGFVQFALPNS